MSMCRRGQDGVPRSSAGTRANDAAQGSAPPILWLVTATLLLSLLLLAIVLIVPPETKSPLPDAVQLVVVIVLGVSILMNLLFISSRLRRRLARRLPTMRRVSLSGKTHSISLARR